MPMLLLRKPGRANGGLFARAYPFTRLFGIDTVTPDTHVTSSGVTGGVTKTVGGLTGGVSGALGGLAPKPSGGTSGASNSASKPSA